MQAAVSAPTGGMAYGVGSAAPYDIYVYDGVGTAWVNNGAIQGPQGIQGDTGAAGTTGADGATGAQGDTGVAGTDGQSAYAAAQSGGYSGVLADFYADLGAMNGFAAELAAL